jgi:hypothetical protein
MCPHSVMLLAPPTHCQSTGCLVKLPSRLGWLMSCSVVLKHTDSLSVFGDTVFFVDDSRSILELKISPILKLCYVDD